MGSTKLNKAQKRAAREAFNRFLSLLLAMAMILQTSPLAYAQAAGDVVNDDAVTLEAQANEEAPAEEPTADPEVVPTDDPEIVPADDPEDVPADDPVVDPVDDPEVTPTDDPVVDPVDEPADDPVVVDDTTTEPAEGEGTTTEPADPAEPAEPEEQEKATISVHVENATVTIGEQKLTSDGTVEVPAGEELSFSVKAADGYELGDGSVKVTVDGSETTLSGSYKLAADQVKDGTAISVAAKKTDTKTVYKYEDGNVRVTATLDKGSAIPDDAWLSVTPVTKDSPEYNYDAYMGALNDSVEGEGVYDDQNTLLYDVAFLYVDEDGNTVELQPEEGYVTVEFAFKRQQLSEDISAGSAANVEVTHLPLADWAKADTTAESTAISADDVRVEALDASATGTDAVEVRTDSFSVYAFSYTVDFTYDGYTYSIAGESEVLLSALLERLGIDVDVADVVAVTFSDPELVSVEQVEGDWKLTSLKAFDTEETLTIELANGDKYVITVTDDQEPITLNPYISSRVIQYRVSPTSPWIDYTPGTELDNGWELKVSVDYTLPTGTLSSDNRVVTYEIPVTGFDVEEVHDFEIKNSDNVTIGHMDIVDGLVTLTFTSDFASTGQAITGSFSFVGVADFTYGEEPYQINFGGDGGTVIIRRESVEKKDLSIAKTHGTITVEDDGDYTWNYTVTVSSTDGTGGQPVDVSDTVTLSSASFPYTHGTPTVTLVKADASTEVIASDRYTYASSGTDWSITGLPALAAGEQYTITYSATIDAPAPPYSEDYNGITQNVNNTASATYGATPVSTTHKIQLKPENVKKNTANNNVANTSTWEITINPNCHDITGWTFTDTMFGDMSLFSDVVITSQNATSHKVTLKIADLIAADPDGDGKVTSFSYTFNSGGVFTAKDLRNPFKIKYSTSGTGYNTSSFAHATLSYTDTQSGGVVPGPGTWNKKAVLTPLLDTNNKRIKFTWYSSQYGLTGTITEGTTSSISDDLIQPVYELPNGEEVAPLHYMYLGPTGPNGEKGIQYVFEDNLKLSTADGARYRFHSGSPTNCQYSASGADTGWVDTTDVELELKGYILNEDGVTYTEVTDGQTPITRWTLFIKAKNHDFNLNSIFLSNERYYESFVDYSGYEPYVREINSIVENGLKVGDDTGYVQTVAQQYVSSQYLDKKITGTKYIAATGGWYVKYQVDFPVDLYETYGADLVLKDQRSSAQGAGYGQFIDGRTSSSPEYNYRPLAYTSVSKTSGNSYGLTRNTHWKYDNLNDETGYVEFNVYNLPAQATDNEKNIRIIYWVRYDTDPFWNDPLHTEKTYDNEITDNLDLGLHGSTTYTYQKQSNILEKTGHQMVDEGGNLTNYVGFYVYLNHPTPVDVDPTSDTLTLTDTFSETTATFEEDALKVYDYDPDNAPTYVGNEVTEGWTHTFDSATNTLTMTLPDERALVVEYVYNLNTVPSTVTSIQNNALLNGTYPRVISKEFDYNDISAEANQRKIEIIKAEAGNYNVKLDGVEFLFQKYTANGWEDIGTYTTDENGEINFDIIDMNLEENVLYCMTETAPKDGYLNGDGESELKFYFAITAEHATTEDTLAVLTQDGHHPENFMPTEANTTIYPYKGGQMYLENVKIIPVTAQIPVKKVLSGREWKNGDTFTFTLTRSTTNAPLPPTAGRTVTITKDTPNYTDKFGVITFTEPGTYVYKVKETKGTIAGITYSTVTKQVTIKVEMGENGHLVITSPSSGTIATQSFTNTYKATGSATFSAKKTGENLGDRTFQFELLNENDEVIQTSDPVKQGETWTFTQINYDKKVDLGGQNYKTFTYKIREKLPEGVTAQNPTKDGVTYDTHVETVTVVVTDDTNGHLVVTYNGNTSFTTPEFENSYSATGTAPLEAKKAITGADWPSGAKATFTVTANDGGPLPETTSVVLTAPGTANFGNITFSLADAGKTYKYTIDETPEGFGQGWTRSTSITATVVVGDDDGDGTLECTVSYSPSHKTITNAYTASGSATLSAMKAASTTLGDRTFQFELLDANDRVIETSAAVKQNETATFTTITYELEDLGGQPFKTYTYKIREKLPEGVSAQNPTKDGVTYDTRIVTTVVKVTNNGAGQLVVTYDGNETFTTPVFENDYEAKGSATLNAKKAANTNLADRTFQFELLDANDQVIETSAAVKQGKTATFTTINYTLADLGGETSKEFTYKIREKLPEGVTAENPTKDGVTYDTTVKTTVVKVTDLGNGNLKVEYDGNESFSTPEFSNSYAA
ncbi:MAG: FctA domain-containing protein, partial [Coriobacteriales bacterium]|nr:FctA domain-containing protein [Coriobacteriales bacterium]